MAFIELMAPHTLATKHTKRPLLHPKTWSLKYDPGSQSYHYVSNQTGERTCDWFYKLERGLRRLKDDIKSALNDEDTDSNIGSDPGSDSGSDSWGFDI
jgi:hypothetical protein